MIVAKSVYHIIRKQNSTCAASLTIFRMNNYIYKQSKAANEQSSFIKNKRHKRSVHLWAHDATLMLVIYFHIIETKYLIIKWLHYLNFVW